MLLSALTRPFGPERLPVCDLYSRLRSSDSFWCPYRSSYLVLPSHHSSFHRPQLLSKSLPLQEAPSSPGLMKEINPMKQAACLPESLICQDLSTKRIHVDSPWIPEDPKPGLLKRATMLGGEKVQLSVLLSSLQSNRQEGQRVRCSH
jgi:hypothetical protein